MLFPRTQKSIIFICILACVWIYPDPWKPQARYAATALRYQQTFAQEEQVFMQEFFLICGVTQQEWEAFKVTCKDAYVKDEQQRRQEAHSRCLWPISQTIKNRFSSLLQQSNITNPIELIRDNSPTNTEMQALQSTIFMDETLANTLRSNEDEMDAGLLHEMAHIRFDDDFITFCMFKLKHAIANYGTTDQRVLWKVVSAIKNKVQNNRPIDEQAWQSFVQRWYYFRERRADIFSGLIDLKYAKAWVAFWMKFKHGILVEMPSNAHDHPPAMVRYEYMHKLTNDMAQSV